MIDNLIMEAGKTRVSLISDVPGIPLNLAVASVAETAIGIKWEEPNDDGGSPLVRYQIESREAARRDWQKFGVLEVTEEKLQFLLKPLTENCQYYARVAAENDVGLGEWAELSQPITAKHSFGNL